MNFLTRMIARTLIVVFATVSTVVADEMQAPEGYVLIKEELLLVFIDEPDASFIRALAAFYQKDSAAAADEIRRGSGFVRIEAARMAKNANRKDARSAAEKLENLADEIESGDVTSPRVLRNTFADVDNTLAKAYSSEGEESLAKRAMQNAGYMAKAGAHRLENAAIWAGQSLKSGTRKSISMAKKAAGGAAVMAESAGDWLKAISRGTKEVEPAIEK